MRGGEGTLRGSERGECPGGQQYGAPYGKQRRRAYADHGDDV